MITKRQYNALKKKQTTYDTWAGQYIQSNRWIVIPSDAKLPVKFGNKERSMIEVYEWVFGLPSSYFLYIREKDNTAVNFMGEILGSVSMGREYYDNFGGVRVSVDIKGTNGIRYHGTYFKSAGQYARIKAYKNQDGAK